MIKTTIIPAMLFLLCCFMVTPAQAVEPEVVPFVVQLTRTGDNFGQRRVFMQIDKVLNELGEKNLHIEVVAYEDDIHALLENNEETSQLLVKLANRGVRFKACRISMKSWGLEEDEFPLEVEYIPAGAVEVIRLQMQGYKYWRP